MKFLLLLLLMFSSLAFGAKILKNNTGSPVLITDTGVTVPASGQYTILATEDFIFAASSDTVILVGDSTLTVNDGTQDLSISDGTDLIKGFFPKRVQILGDDELYAADVTLTGGKKKLEVNATVSISTTNLIGIDPNPDSWCRIDVAGAISDTVRIQIPDDSCDVTSTATATEAADEIAFADLVVLDFNADATCKVLYHAKRVTDNAVIHISALKIDGLAERSDSGDFVCTATGTTTVTEGFDNLISRQKLVKVVPDYDDPRVGATNVTGSIQINPSSIDNRILAYAENGGSSDMRVDGSTTPVDFIYTADADDTVFVSQVRCFGGGNGIKFGQFLSKPSTPLTNGIQFVFRSNSNDIALFPIKATEDWKNLFAAPSATDFKIDIQAGADQFIAILKPAIPFVIHKSGELSPLADDYIKVTIQDDLSSGLTSLRCMIAGFVP